MADADLVRFLAYFGREGEVVAWCEEIRDRDQDRGKEIRDRDQDRGKERMLLLPNNPSEYLNVLSYDYYFIAEILSVCHLPSHARGEGQAKAQLGCWPSQPSI